MPSQVDISLTEYIRRFGSAVNEGEILETEKFRVAGEKVDE